MLSTRSVQNSIGYILLTGTLIATVIVMIGGAWYLLQNGTDTLQNGLLATHSQHTTIAAVWQFAFSMTPLGIVQLGILLLIATQILRVLLLCLYYVALRDRAFTAISLFILVVLVYSSCWRH